MTENLKLSANVKALKVFHLFLFFSSSLILLFLHFCINNISFNSYSSALSFTEILPIGIAMICLLISNLFFSKKIAQIKTHQRSLENFFQYRKACTSKWALLNFAILVNVLFYFFVSHHSAIIITAIGMLGFFYLNKPRFES